MKKETFLLIMVLFMIIGTITADRIYVPIFQEQFKKLEKERIVTSNKLATAKIIYENLNHVRDLVFKNMDFPDQKDSISHESIYFEFLTTCINDLKMKVVSVKPLKFFTKGNIIVYPYDIELEGDFFKFGELCAKFENSRRIISIESYKVDLLENATPTFRSGGNKGINISIRVNTYRVRKGADS